MLQSDLGQKESALRMKRDEEPVTPNFDRFGGDRRGWRKQRDLDGERIELLGTHGRKPWIFERGAGSAANDGFPQRLACLDDADAALQPPRHMQRNENAAALLEDAFLWDVFGEFPVGDRFLDSSARQL